MKINKMFVSIACILVLLSLFVQVTMPFTALAQDETKEEVKISTKYPELKGNASNDFSFDLDVKYVGGKEPKIFNLSVKGPDQYFYSIQQSYGGTSDIASVKLDPTLTYGESIKLRMTPNFLNPPDPGEYPVIFEASSGNIRGTINLKVIVTARYAIELSTPDGVLSGQVTPAKDNTFKINIKNTGSSPLENVNLSYRIKGSPSGWDVKFDPEKVDAIAPKNTKEVKIIIKPGAKTISGDYEIVITAKPENNATSSDLTLRVTVLTQTIWGWIGVAIVVIVIAGLIAMFIFLGRR